jgi:monovalent cation:H+ antiporter-2, CPA2 family
MTASGHLPSVAPLIRDLAWILAVASGVALLCQRLKQPVVLGYILAGILVAAAGRVPGTWLPVVSDAANIRAWGELGVIFLMFTLGLEFSFRKLSKVGVAAIATAGFEISAMIGLGYCAGRVMGWRMMDSVFAGALVSISSTTIIVRALDEMGLKSRRFAETILAVLIVEDLFAVLILVALSSVVENRTFSGGLLFMALMAAARLVLVVGCWFVTGYFLLPRFVRWAGRVASLEVLMLLALGLCLCLAVLADAFGYSVALGGFIMGSILAESSESFRIENQIEPLRDLFAAIFFVSIGMLIEPGVVWREAPIIAALSAVVILGKITFVSLGSLASGHPFRTAVQVGFGMGQIGEFSFIIANLGAIGLAQGVTTQPLMPIAVSVSLITAFATPYLLRVSHRVAVATEEALPIGLREALARYALWSQERRADRSGSAATYRATLRWFLSGLIVSAIFLFVDEAVYPRLMSLHLFPPVFSAFFAWGISVILSAPFLLGMFNSFRFGTGQERRPRWQDAPYAYGALFLNRLASLAWIGGLSIEFFPARIALFFTGAAAAALCWLFFRQLDVSYHWFESGFLSTFRDTAKTPTRADVLRDLAPWDAHLVRLKVHPNAGVVGKTLLHSELRSRYGLSVVAIQRGISTIVSPRASHQIFPDDELLVLGTDEQIEAARSTLERPAEDRLLGLRNNREALEGYQMQTMAVSPLSPITGHNIRESGIRHRFGAFVVGVERQNDRHFNPSSEMVIHAGDRLWVVGEKERLDALGDFVETAGDMPNP